MPADALARLDAALSAAAGVPVELERPSDPSHGDYATSVALRLARERKRPPRELAADLVEAFEGAEGVEQAEIAGPGFVNLRVSGEWLTQALAEIVARGAAYGAGEPDPALRIQVEMVSANPTGPITVASARNGAYGDSVARLLELAGHHVEREYYYNDAGAQMDRFRASVDAVRRGEEPPPDGYHGDYVRELAAQDGDPVPRMLEQIEATLERFRIHFDGWSLESGLRERIDDLLPRLPTYERDGAVWVRSSEFGDDKDQVIIRSSERGGQPTYRAADIAYLEDKLHRGYDRAIYVLGADHHGTRNWYAAVARMLGYDPERVEVLLYQLVHLTRGDAQTKMSKRRGDVVFLEELIDDIGVDAARWYLVDRGPDRTIEIDVDVAKLRERKNAVYYVQYVHARTCGIFREAGDAEVGGSKPAPLTTEERELVKRLLEFPGVASDATERRAPHAIAEYAIRLADDFHRFYHDRTKHRIVGTDAQAFRLGLARAVQTVIARSLQVLGVEAPETM